MRARIFAEENRKWWTLGAVAFGLFMIMLDNTVVFVALTAMQEDLKISTSELQWVVNGYALTFAVLMLTGGKLADMLGRRRIFIAGLAIFTAASLACGLATGASFGLRQLYTDADEVLFQAARPILLNGIEDVIGRSDLADRALFLTLPPIADRRGGEATLA